MTDPLRRFLRTAGLAVLVLALGTVLAFRIRRERSDRRVEICVNWQDSQDLLKKNPFRREIGDYVSLDGFLERCRIIGASSVASREETLQDLIDSGQIVYLPSAELEKFRALGLAAEETAKGNLLWIRRDRGLASRIAGALDGLDHSPVYEKGRLKTRKIGDYTLLQIPSSWEPFLDLSVGVPPEQTEILARYGLKRAALIEESPRVPPQENAAAPEGVSAWVVVGAPPDLRRKRFFTAPDLVAELRPGRSRFPVFENQPFPYGRLLAEAVDDPSRAVRAHTIPLDELRTMKPGTAVSRWVRAVRERSCRFLYFRWNPDWNTEENLGVLRAVAQALKDSGYRLECLTDADGPPFVKLPWTPLRQALAFLAAVLGPLAAVRFLRREPSGTALSSAVRSWAGALGISVLTGAAVVALLPDSDFVSGAAVFRGVKAALVLPLLAAAFILFRPQEISETLRRRVVVADLLALAAAAYALRVMIARSGNFTSTPSPLELSIRSWLESALVARPRFKEFLIGHPLMVLGLYLTARDRGSAAGRFMVWAGTIGLVSVVNSFCHLHTPVELTLLRTFNGAWLGLVLGLLLVWTWRVFRERRATAPSAPPVA